MRSATILSVLLIGFLAATGCDTTVRPPGENNPPNTTVANVPVEGDTLFALVTLHWDGEDEDGFVEKYEYRYVTHHVDRGDSVATEWQETDATSLTISFESSDRLNRQVFQVRSVDNSGSADPTPATRTFFTEQTILPEAELVAPAPNATYFVLEEETDWFSGISLSMTARDMDGSIVEYGWSVDGGEWNWTSDTTLFVPPSAFEAPLEGEHELRVTARDNTNLTDPDGDAVTIRLIRPRHDKRLLIIDETLESSFPAGVNAADADVDQFYADLFDPTSMWDYHQRGMPPRDTLGRYQLVVWHADNNYSSDPHELPQHIEVIEDYLNTGGNFVMSGWRILKSFAPDQNFPLTFNSGTFVHDYLHIITADETPLGSGFTEAIGVGDYSNVLVDADKLANVFPYYGKLGQINLIRERAGFTNVVYTFEGTDVSYRGTAVGLRYYGTSFNAVVLGFPIFFLEKEDASVLASEVMSALGFD